MSAPTLTGATQVHPSRSGLPLGGPDTGMLAAISRAPTLGAALREWAEQRPDDLAFHVYDLTGDCTELTVGRLYDRAANNAEAFAGTGVAPGDRVGISLDTGPALLGALFGAMLLGAVPVLLEPPLAEGRARIWAARVGQAVDRTGLRLLVTDPALRPHATLVAAGRAVSLIDSAEAGQAAAGRAAAGPAQWAAGRPDDVAFLQLTSGTLGHAKAAVLTHRAVFANAAAIAARTPYRTDDLMVSWLPLHHDMGLLGATLAPFLHRLPAVLLPPMSFVLRPERWLWAVHRFRGTLSPGPNFGYQLCATKVSDEAASGLDLSSWRATYSGAEVVNADTVELWQRRFGRYGLVPESMRPAYGMAEVGVAATLTAAGRPPRVIWVDAEELVGTGRAVPAPAGHPRARPHVSVGTPLLGYAVAVLDEAGNAAPERVRGRIVVRGPSLMDGYHGDPAATAAAVRDGWLHTGDLGFLADGELFVTGRANDLVIVAGRNYHPYPAEAAAAAVPGVRPGGAAVVGVPDPLRGTDAVVVVVESAQASRADRAGALAEAVAQAVTDELGLRPQRVAVVRPGMLPRTPSGKLQRARIATDLAAGWPSTSESAAEAP